MHITESRLRRIIRQVIRENYVFKEGVPMSPSDPDYELVTDIINYSIHELKDDDYNNQSVENIKDIVKHFCESPYLYGFTNSSKSITDDEKIKYISHRVYVGIHGDNNQSGRRELDALLKSIDSGMSFKDVPRKS